MKPIAVIQNCEIESPGFLGSYLNEKKIPFMHIHAYNDDPLPEPGEVSLIVALGTPTSVTEYRKHPFLVREFELITNSLRESTPILGLCFGAQLLAHALGAKVQANKVKEIGLKTTKLTDAGTSDPVFAGFPPEFPVFQWHGDTWRNPFGAEWLATSDNCKYQAFRQGVHVGLQFHLEADPDEIPRWCEAYQSELDEEGLSADVIIKAVHDAAETLREANYRMMDNYLELVQAEQTESRAAE